MKATTPLDRTVALSPLLREAVEEQQVLVFDLRSLIQCIQCAGDEGRELDDLFSAMRGLLRLADELMRGLDPMALEQRARAILTEAEAVMGAAPRSDNPPAPDAVN